MELENQLALHKRHESVCSGKDKTPNPTREDIVELVQCAWLMIDHSRVATAGYKQTGPTMPLTGAVSPSDVFKDLLKVMEANDETSTALEVGMTLRDEAVAFVKAGFDEGKWGTWSDCHKLIEEHTDGGAPLAEGLEAFGHDPYDEEEGDEDGEDGDEDGEEALSQVPSGEYADDPDSPGGGSSGDDSDFHPSDAADGHDGEEDDGDDGDEDDGDGAAEAAEGACLESVGEADEAAAEAAEGACLKSVAEARQVLYDHAMRNHDDLALRRMRTEIRKDNHAQQEAATEIASHLRKRAETQRDADAKRRKEALEVERLAGKDFEEAKSHRANAELALVLGRRENLRQTLLVRRDADFRKQQALAEKAHQRWLQTEYPVTLARQCIDTCRALSPAAQQCMAEVIRVKCHDRVFDRCLYIRDPWEQDKSVTREWCQAKPFVGGGIRSVRCGIPFLDVIDRYAPPHLHAKDAVDTLRRLLAECVPHSSKIFAHSFSPWKLLHINEYVLEKAFVYAIMALSKWLGREFYPCGIFGKWPPPLPVDLTHDEDDAPHLRIGMAASSSSSVF